MQYSIYTNICYTCVNDGEKVLNLIYMYMIVYTGIIPQQCSPVIGCARLAGHPGTQWPDAVAVAVVTAQTAGTDGPGRTP